MVHLKPPYVPLELAISAGDFIALFSLSRNLSVLETGTRAKAARLHTWPAI
jgi:hypothetical protein